MIYVYNWLEKHFMGNNICPQSVITSFYISRVEDVAAVQAMYPSNSFCEALYDVSKGPLLRLASFTTYTVYLYRISSLFI